MYKKQNKYRQSTPQNNLSDSDNIGMKTLLQFAQEARLMVEDMFAMDSYNMMLWVNEWIDWINGYQNHPVFNKKLTLNENKNTDEIKHRIAAHAQRAYLRTNQKAQGAFISLIVKILSDPLSIGPYIYATYAYLFIL